MLFHPVLPATTVTRRRLVPRHLAIQVHMLLTQDLGSNARIALLERSTKGEQCYYLIQNSSNSTIVTVTRAVANAAPVGSTQEIVRAKLIDAMLMLILSYRQPYQLSTMSQSDGFEREGGAVVWRDWPRWQQQFGQLQDLHGRIVGIVCD